MRTIPLRELLTAAVDGELTSAERKAAERVLRDSETARSLYAQLQADAARVQSLPRTAAPADLADNVLNVIKDRAILPTPLPPVRQPARKFNWSMLPVWVNLATAVAVLIVISAGSYFYFSASQDYLAQREQLIAAKNNATGNDTTQSKSDGSIVAKPRQSDATPGPEAIVQMPRVLGPEIGPSPRVVPPDLVAGPLHDMQPEIEHFDPDKIRVSQLFHLHDLVKDSALKSRLATEMKKDELIRLDLFCQTTPKALVPIMSTLQSRGIVVVTDAFVQDRLKRKAATEVMVFTEALSADEVSEFVAALGAVDAKNVTGEFSTLVAAPFLPSDLERLGKAIGVPNVLPKPAKAKQPVDIRKPLPEGTAAHVAATLTNMGTMRPAKAEKVALVAAYSPMNPNPGLSKEIKQFLDRRGQRPAHAKPLMLVLRTIQ